MSIASLRWRDVIAGGSKLGNSICDELDSLIAQITGTFNQEHNADGTHSDITADSIEVGSITVTSSDDEGESGEPAPGDPGVGFFGHVVINGEPRLVIGETFYSSLQIHSDESAAREFIRGDAVPAELVLKSRGAAGEESYAILSAEGEVSGGGSDSGYASLVLLAPGGAGVTLTVDEATGSCVLDPSTTGVDILDLNADLRVNGSSVPKIILNESGAGADLKQLSLNYASGEFLLGRRLDDDSETYFFSIDRANGNVATDGSITAGTSVIPTSGGAALTSGKGTQSAANNTATTLFTVSGASARYDVSVGLNVNDAAAYEAFATVLVDASTARIVANNATNMTLTLSGLNVQGTQVSGATQTIKWRFIKTA